MNRLDRRVQALEVTQPLPERRAHRVIQEEHQTEDEVIDAYGRDKIGPDDLVIVWRVVTPGNGK